jgi:hypothetical protein
VRADPGKPVIGIFHVGFHVARHDVRRRLGKGEKRPRFGAFSLLRIIPGRRMSRCNTDFGCAFNGLIKQQAAGRL